MFITLEGGEGTGKSILASKITQKLIANQYPTVMTKEPGSCEQNKLIREMILYSVNYKMDANTEVLLYAADRIENLNNIIIPALKQKKIVICDRFLDSSVAYQGYGRQLGEELVYKMNYYALKYMPDITFYIDLDPLLGIQRIKKMRQEKVDKFDLENINFHERVRQGYLSIYNNNKKRIFLIDGKQSLDVIFEIIYKKIIQMLNNGVL